MYLLRITFKSFQKINQLKQNLLKLKNINKLKNIQIHGIFQTKSKNKIFTLLRSPHVNKKSREHFIYKNYTPKIDIKFKNIFQLLNFLILIKKILSENSLMNIKIIKKN
uniref:40S ribosomal protein S10 n=6 Tax=Phytophthora TaxID=4783 RepID=K9LZ05_9STRA|nr:ribosomal protein S10 [Phytophthora castaneae]AEP41553.1 40S ribosomal protein S10 [Phytophthora cf. heveae 2 FM-2011]AEP41607.1 40S ribosomal protein S10 [Phytophthora katsurae]AFQ02269.1 40S ribosomal protein S10 [Phytophthora cf. heveae 1 FM-2012]AFQ02275.1 40S ribosomal protein S10 [Phytophthora cf. heveae 2 FM-2012]QPN53958.1 ribosomal protein S10 [Phytophthora novae-guineae]UXG53507.1 ribosomal protein S10 [Phytophthora heveae]